MEKRIITTKSGKEYYVCDWWDDYKAVPNGTQNNMIQNARAAIWFRKHEGFNTLDEVETYMKTKL